MREARNFEFPFGIKNIMVYLYFLYQYHILASLKVFNGSCTGNSIIPEKTISKNFCTILRLVKRMKMTFHNLAVNICPLSCSKLTNYSDMRYVYIKCYLNILQMFSYHNFYTFRVIPLNFIIVKVCEKNYNWLYDALYKLPILNILIFNM